MKIVLTKSNFYNPELNTNPLLIWYYYHFVSTLSDSSVWNLAVWLMASGVVTYSAVFSFVYIYKAHFGFPVMVFFVLEEGTSW